MDDMFRLSGRVSEWLVAKLMADELTPPVLNPLIPPKLRPARIVSQGLDKESSRRFLLDEETYMQKTVGFFNKVNKLPGPRRPRI